MKALPAPLQSKVCLDSPEPFSDATSHLTKENTNSTIFNNFQQFVNKATPLTTLLALREMDPRCSYGICTFCTKYSECLLTSDNAVLRRTRLRNHGHDLIKKRWN
jgi:hypothetical protein